MQITKKTEINSIISCLPDAALDDVLTYITDIQKKMNEKESTDKILHMIFEEEKQLLERLAK